ncbi:MAG: sigma 54-interacting transcriptional regulator [Pirellulales bacterium]|nr:sigma 54-interacting transcriptional regulator [Pirellulales bacterium]
MHRFPHHFLCGRTSDTFKFLQWGGGRITLLNRTPLLDLDEDAALRTIFEGTAKETGERFFRALVENLAGALNVHGAMVTRCGAHQRELQALAFWMDGRFVEDYRFDITGTPCEQVIEECRLIHFPDRLLDLFPSDSDAMGSDLVSYLGMPLQDVDGKILGHMAVVDRRPLPEDSRLLAIFRIFAARAAAELQRLSCEAELRQREDKLNRLVDSAMDAIVELDGQFRAGRINSAAEAAFECPAGQVFGRDLSRFFTADSRTKLRDLMKHLESRPEGRQYLWIAGGLAVCPSQGARFSAEATLSRFDSHGKSCFTLILRNVNDRIEAERKIQSLTTQAEYLKTEIKELRHFEPIIGRSGAMQAVLRDVEQVAPTDATVLILGETGTGKELIARAIHAASRRRDGPFVRVNCAAVPAHLMESEFFGHEKGAFTGATQKREGRFALADGGTIFLDEIGELSIDLQAKLLRVLQEGEFEAVGSSRTRKVDVRILAATNCDLAESIKEGRFREDLFYRLYVFPIVVPPLRDRAEDIPLLASAFALRYAKEVGRAIEPPSAEYFERLQAYHWPGNVRELQNVIERAVITSHDGRLNLARALPETSIVRVPCVHPDDPQACRRIRTAAELREEERRNIVLALESANWRVAGEGGAARLLGMNASTLNSRIRALGIQRLRPC